jgi:F0F1-type ATP synthase membrane subunit a
MFWMIFVYRFVNKIQYFLLLLSFLEFVSIFVRTVTLPNRITINLFTGSLIMTIVGSGYSVT